MLKNFTEKVLLKNFIKIDLSKVERQIAEDAIKFKYIPCLRNALISVILILPALLFLNTTVLMQVLIPVTMVTGVAWFGITLANMKKKFEKFGLELTINLFESFIISLLILFLLSLISLNKEYLLSFLIDFDVTWIKASSGILGTIVVFRILYLIFLGALKYDINDAMLTGQAEYAEKYFKKSLSFLHNAAEQLRLGKGLEVANYYLGFCFQEIVMYIKYIDVRVNGELKEISEIANNLRGNPTMPQAEADKLIKNLFNSFIKIISVKEEDKSYINIINELNFLNENKGEPQHLVDARFALIFEEMGELLNEYGENLFVE